MSVSKSIGTAYPTTNVNWQNLAAGSQIISGEVDISTANLHQVLAISVQVGRKDSTAFTTGWPMIIAQFAGKASVANKWHRMAPVTLAKGSSIAATTLNGALSAGVTSGVVTSATNFSTGELIFLGHTSDVTKYELARIQSISGTTLTFEEATTSAHDNGCEVTGQAEEYLLTYNISSFTRHRLIIDCASSGRDIRVEALYGLLQVA